jgi:hypothetical protein
LFEVSEKKSWVSLFGGLLFIAGGIVLALSSLGVIGLPIPAVPAWAMAVIVIIASIFLLVDGFLELGMHMSLGIFSMLVGIVCLGGSAVFILANFGILSFSVGFVTPLIFHIILFLLGLLILIGAFMF